MLGRWRTEGSTTSSTFCTNSNIFSLAGGGFPMLLNFSVRVRTRSFSSYSLAIKSRRRVSDLAIRPDAGRHSLCVFNAGIHDATPKKSETLHCQFP